MIEGFLKADEGKVVSKQWCTSTALQLANNEDGVSGTSTRHKAELHFINVHHLTDEEVYYPFQHIYDLICELETTIVATVKSLIFAFIFWLLYSFYALSIHFDE